MYLHLDGNTFYASCERVFQPSLNGRPVIVLSNNDGCIVTLTKEAKALGLKRGTPLFKVRGIVEKNQVQVFSSNYELYGDMSRRMMKTVASLVPKIEVYSIDECFADVTGMEDLTELGRRIRQRVLQWVGIPTGIGIAPTKTLAKLSNKIAKTYPVFGGVFNWNDLPLERQSRALASIDIGDVWGVGRQYAAALQNMGIANALQLRSADAALLRRRFGVVLSRTQQELREIPCIPFEETVKSKEQICSSRSFAQECFHVEPLLTALSIHTAEAARKLRRQHSEAQHLTVFFLTSPFKQSRAHVVWKEMSISPTADTLTLTQNVFGLAREGFRAGFGYKKAGVILSGIVPVGQGQRDLFAPPPDTSKRMNLMLTLDALTHRFGKKAMQVAGAAWAPGTEMRRDKLSRCYTTRLSDLLWVS